MILFDMFSGIGGFHLGLEMAGFEFEKSYYSDIDEYANKIYAKHWPDSIPLGDITKIQPDQIMDVDIFTGGFPCQDISVAGKQKGLKNEKNEITRSGLFFEIIRLASVVRPDVIFLENVRNLISGEDGGWMRAVIGAITEIGYDCEWTVLSAQEVGAWHKRERVWIVAYGQCENVSDPSSNGRNIVKLPTEKGSKGKPFEKIIRNSEIPHTRCKHGKQGNTTGMEKDKAKRTAGKLYIEPGSKGYVADSKSRRLEKRKTEKTIQSNVKCRSVQNGKTRFKNTWDTEPKLGRLAHGIPHRVDRLRCLGNAVVPQCVAWIGKRILRCFK